GPSCTKGRAGWTSGWRPDTVGASSWTAPAKPSPDAVGTCRNLSDTPRKIAHTAVVSAPPLPWTQNRPRSDRVARGGAGHAAGAAAAGAEFGRRDGQHLDTGGLEPGVGLHIAFVGDHHTGRDGQRVVAVVPLLAFGDHRIEPGRDHPQPVDPHRPGRGL